MVITVTLNPAMDKTLRLDGIRIDEVNNVISSRFDIGGKGINVSKVLKALDTTSIAMGFIGENFEEIFARELKKYGVINHLTPIHGDTRTNIKIVDEKNRTFTDVNETGPTISSNELNQFLALFEDMVKEKDVVVLSGSVPLGLPLEIYEILTKKSLEKGAYVVADLAGENLKQVIQCKPQVIKPNEQEFYNLLGKEELTENEIVHEARRIVQSGIEKVLVSRGRKGSVFVTKKHAYISESINVDVKSTVGAGDAMVSALVYAMGNSFDDVETFALAQAAATATVMREGTKAPSREEIMLYLDEAKRKIREVIDVY